MKMSLLPELVEMQSTDPGGVFPVHPTSTTPNVTSPTSNQNHNNSSSGNGGGTGAHTPPIRSKNTWGRFQTWMDQWRGSRQLVLIIVAIALLLDNMLLTVVGKLKQNCPPPSLQLRLLELRTWTIRSTTDWLRSWR